jgi:outer membrane protein
MRITILLYIVFFIFNISHAQEYWDLKKCIDYAFANNIQIKQTQIQSDLAEMNVEQSRYNMLPNLNGFASHSYNFGQRIDPFTNQFANQRVQSNNFFISSSVTLFNGFQQLNAVEKAKIDYQLSEQTIEKIKNNIALNIAAVYLQILFNQELIKIAENQISTTRFQLRRIEQLVKSGSVPEGDLLEIESQLAQEELQLVNAENQLDLSYLSLKQLLQVDVNTNIKIVVPEIDMPEGAVATTSGQIFDAALKVMPEIRESELRIKSAETSINIANGGRYPSISMSGSLGTGYSGLSRKITGVTPYSYISGYTASGEEVFAQDFVYEFVNKPFSEQFSDNLNQMIGFNLSVPIFNGFSIKYGVKQSKIAMSNAQLDMELTKNQLYNDIQSALNDAKAALKRFHATQKSLHALQLSFEYAEKRFQSGLINAVDYGTIKNQLLKTESDLLQSKYDFLFKTKILAFYQGQSLAF